MSTTLTINPWLYKSKGKDGLAPVYYRLNLGDEETQLSSGININVKLWESDTGRANTKFKGSSEINREIESDKQKLKKIYLELKESSDEVSLQLVKQIFQGKDPKRKALLEVIEYHNNLMKSEIGKTYARSTYLQYVYLLDKIKSFLTYTNKPHNISIKEVDYKFITEFINYIKVVHHNNQTTVHKDVTKLRKIVNLAIDMDWVTKNPFRQIKVKKGTPPRTYLTHEELVKVENHNPKTKHLELIKDCSLFQVYIGAAYEDLRNLTTSNIIKGIDTQEWIVYHRKKTNKKARVPLIPEASKLIDKYSTHSCRTTNNLLLPIISNQKMNKGVKELMKACGISKNISTHSFRRTFATTLTVRQGVSLEAVRDMLGQTDIKTTQIYSVVEDFKISSEMMKVFNRGNKQELDERLTNNSKVSSI